jgi:Major Facilitator Superfamily
MRDTGAGARTSRASRGSRFLSASHTAVRAGATAATGAARASAAAVNGTGRVVHRLTSASGAGRTGLSQLLELSIASSIGDAFVVIALAGTLFFSSSAEQARGRAALALIVTIAPYAVLAPLIGPMLDRVRQGNKFILMGTLLARGLLCWGMAGAVQHDDVVTLLPAALGVLIVQKAYAVTKAAITPRLLPPRITLVSANSRFSLASLLASSAGVAVALGIDHVLGDHGVGAAWVLRVATLIYLAAMALGWRLPDRVDEPTAAYPADDSAASASAAERTAGGSGAFRPAAGPAQGPNGTMPLPAANPGADSPGGNGSRPGGPGRSARPAARRRLFAPPHVGPAVAEAMRANAAIRLFYGFMISFLAFILRTEKFGHISYKVALGGLAVAIAAGGIIGTGIGSALRARAPQLVIFIVLALSTVVTALCAILFGLGTVLVVALCAAIAQTLVKASLDSVLQREIPARTRSSAFALSETLHQLALVIGGLIGIVLSLTNSGLTGLTVAAVGLALSLCLLILGRRNRVLRAARSAPSGG